MKDYLDPRWQRVRLSILHRDGFQCQSCETRTETLHVHHRVYAKKRKIWEADERDLVTLCEHCHARCESIVNATRKAADFLVAEASRFGEDGESPIETLLRVASFVPKSESFEIRMEIFDDLIGYFHEASKKAKELMEAASR